METHKSINHYIKHVDYCLVVATNARILQANLRKRGSFHVAGVAPPPLLLVTMLSRDSAAVTESLALLSSDAATEHSGETGAKSLCSLLQ